MDDARMSDKEQWLRDRGVQIETPDDRRMADAVLAADGDDRPKSIAEQIQRLGREDASTAGGGRGAAAATGVRFVHVPHDAARPVSTVILPQLLVDALKGGDVLPRYVASYFADGKSIDETLFREQAGKQHLLGGDVGNAGGVDPARLTSAALAGATASGSVETFALVRPSSTNGRQGVYVYLDEVGLLKKLPHNRRASDLARRCGYDPAPNFYGDVFVGRVSSEGGLRNVDLATEDLVDPTREWIRQAPAENVAWQRAVNEATGREGERQPDHAGTEGVGVQVEGGAGGRCPYLWLQNEEEVEVTVDLAARLGGEGGGTAADKAKVRVAFQPQRITAKYDGETALEVPLYSKLDVDGCTWTLDGHSLVITGEKASEGEIWPRLQLSG